MTSYRKSMMESLAEVRQHAKKVELGESIIDKVKEIASKKSAAKIDGVTVDSFTASAISQVYDKVNDANKKKMEKLPITNLANLAFKMMQKNEFVPEEVELVTELEDLGRTGQYNIKNGKILMSKKDYAKKPRDYKGKRSGKPTLMALDPKSGATTSFEVVFEEVELDEKKETAQYIDGGQEKITVTVDNMRKIDIDNVVGPKASKKWTKVGKKSEFDRARAALSTSTNEEVELDEETIIDKVKDIV